MPYPLAATRTYVKQMVSEGEDLRQENVLIISSCTIHSGNNTYPAFIYINTRGDFSSDHIESFKVDVTAPTTIATWMQHQNKSES